MSNGYQCSPTEVAGPRPPARGHWDISPGNPGALGAEPPRAKGNAVHVQHRECPAGMPGGLGG
eukprot:11666941-Alexandrium_andersonii.AAC.1